MSDTTNMLAPDGSVRAVPSDQIDKYASAGGREVVKILDPSGTARWAPKNELSKYLSAGAKVAPSLPSPSASFSAEPSLGQNIVNMVEHPLNSLETASHKRFRPKAASVGEMAATDLYNVGAGASSVVRHPIDTLRGILVSGLGVRPVVETALNALEQPFEKKEGKAPLYHPDLVPKTPEDAAFAIGQGIATSELTELGGKALSKTIDVARGGSELGGRMVRSAAGAGTGTVKDLLRKVKEDNKAIGEVNASDAEAHLNKTQDALHEQEGRDLAYQQAIKTVQDNAKEAQAAIDKQHEEAVQKALGETREKEDLYQAELRKAEQESEESYNKKVAEVQKKRADAEIARKEELKDYLKKKAKAQQSYEAAERKFRSAQDKQRKIDPTNTKLSNARSALRAAVETAREKALKIGNEKYNSVRAALNPIKARPSFSNDLDVLATQNLPGSKGLPPILKSIAKRAASDEPIRYEDLQADYSILGKEISKGGLDGTTFHAYDELHEAIGKEMLGIAKDADDRAVSEGKPNPHYSTQLTEAQNYWRRMKQTFGKPVSFNDAATKAIGGVTDETRENQIRLLGSFDPSIPKLASHVSNVERGVESLPEPIPSRKLVEQLAKAKAKPYPEVPARRTPIEDPNPIPPREVSPPSRTEVPDRPAQIEPKLPAPPERVPIEDRPLEKPKKTVGMEEVRSAKAKGLEGRQQLIDRAAKYRAIIPIFYAVSDIVRGEMPSAGGLVATAGAPIALQAALNRILSSPKVIDFLTKATPADIAQIPPELRGDFPKILTEAHKRGIKVSPALTLTFAGAAATGGRKRQ